MTRPANSPNTPGRPQKAIPQPLEQLLDKLDARGRFGQFRHQRRTGRASYRRVCVPIAVHHPGGSEATRNVLTRDLGAGGLSFLHNGYLHVGTRVEVRLARYEGGEDLVRGIVRHCDHIGGTWHSVGVKFDQPISPRLYIDPEQAGGTDLEPLNPVNIAGRMLHVEPDELARRLMAHHLRDTRVHLVSAATLEEAGQWLARQPFDLVVADLNLGALEAGGAEPRRIMTALRNGGHQGIIGFAAGPDDAARLGVLGTLDVAGVLHKPCEQERVLASVGQWLKQAIQQAQPQAQAADQSPIHSPLAALPNMRQAIEEFVRNVHALGEALQAGIRQGALERCRVVCSTLDNSGGGYGFEPVAAAAKEAMRSLQATGSVEASATALQHLRDVCARVAADPPQGSVRPANVA